MTVKNKVIWKGAEDFFFFWKNWQIQDFAVQQHRKKSKAIFSIWNGHDLIGSF